MMLCLCCGKEIKTTSNDQEKNSLWHEKCCKRFFGTSVVPDIDISKEVLEAIAIESTIKGYTVPGVQKKLSLHLSKEENIPRLTLVNYPTGYILKPQTEEYDALPEAEYLVMSMAKLVGIKTVPFALVKQDNGLAYITRRIDRPVYRSDIQMLAMEDFCQLDGRLTQDKYKGSYERCGKIIETYSAQRGLDISELFLRIVFSFVVGNSDMHLKNFSLIETSERSDEYVLSAAYDMLPVNIVLPEDEEEVALALNGKKRNLRRKDFLAFASNCKLDGKIAENLIESILKKREKLIQLCRESYVPEDMREKLIELIVKRCDIIG